MSWKPQVFGGREAQQRWYSKYQERPWMRNLYKVLSEFSSYMRKCKRYNLRKQENQPLAPKILPDKNANWLMLQLDVHHRNRTGWGRALFNDFVKWEIEYKKERARQKKNKENMVQIDASISSPTTTKNNQRLNVKKKKRVAAKEAVQDVTSTRSGNLQSLQANAARHVRAHSYRPTTGKYHCPLCDEGFEQLQGLGSHQGSRICATLDIIQKFNTNAGAPGWYSCTSCGELIQGRGNCNEHQNTCTSRPRSFSSSSSSDSSCNFCAMTYPHLTSQYRNLNEHCSDVIVDKDLDHPTAHHSLCNSCDKYIHSTARHRCTVTAVDCSTKWICMLCKLNTNTKHIHDSAFTLHQHNLKYHNKVDDNEDDEDGSLVC